MKLFITLKTPIFFIIILTINITIMAQEVTTKDITGVYSLPSNNPEGGETITIFPDNTFASVYFGGMLKGTWVIKENSVYFTTNVEPQIALYGRESKMLKDSVQLNFSGEFSRKAKVNLNVDTVGIMQHIFNEGANCKDYPYLYKSTHQLKKISFALIDWSIYNETGDTDTFNHYMYEIPKNYNDLVAINLPLEYTSKKKFVVIYKNGGLCFNSDIPTDKQTLDSISEEDKNFYKKYNKKILVDMIAYGNELFPFVEFNGLSENEIQEAIRSYHIIKPTSKTIVKENEIKVKEKSLFTANCD